jgi:hypothetical protein
MVGNDRAPQPGAVGTPRNEIVRRGPAILLGNNEAIEVARAQARP